MLLPRSIHTPSRLDSTDVTPTWDPDVEMGELVRKVNLDDYGMHDIFLTVQRQQKIGDSVHSNTTLGQWSD